MKKDTISWITIYKKNENNIANKIKIFYCSWDMIHFDQSRYEIKDSVLFVKPLQRNELNKSFSLVWYIERLNLKKKEIYLLNAWRWRFET